MQIILKDLECKNVKNLKDIQGEGIEDTSNKNKPRDRKLVSCLQRGDYNELKDKIDKYYSDYKEDEEFYQAICKFCKKKSDKKFLYSLNGNTKWKKLYDYLYNKGFIKN